MVNGDFTAEVHAWAHTHTNKRCVWLLLKRYDAGPVYCSSIEKVVNFFKSCIHGSLYLGHGGVISKTANENTRRQKRR
jgi:hypothetical protein